MIEMIENMYKMYSVMAIAPLFIFTYSLKGELTSNQKD